MSTATFKVVFAGPLVTFQDGGRMGHLRYGVPASGPMDRFSYAAGHVALSQSARTSIEVSLGGLVLECVSGAVTFAITGGGFGGSLDGWGVQTVSAGDKITIRAGDWGSWAYLSFAGNIGVAPWLGHTATHSLSGYGGGSLSVGDVFDVTDAAVVDARVGAIECPDIAMPCERVRVVVGPQQTHFQEGALERFLSEPYQLSDAFDRMGVRLSGPELALGDVLSIPSEPVVRGSVQVSGEQVPTVLLADHQTTGGYPKIATVLSCDLDRLVQNRARSNVRFEEVSAEEAIVAARAYRQQMDAAFEEIAKPRLTLAERLMQENIVGGVVGFEE